MKHYHHMSLDEREMLSRWLSQRKSLSEIATMMGRSKSTLSREIKRSMLTPYSYRALTAEYYVQVRKQIPKKKKRIINNSELEKYIQRHLKLRWSPEQIAKRLQIEYSTDTHMQVSTETIYSYLYVLPKGSLKKELLSYLRQSHRKRLKRGNTHQKRGLIPNMISIEERPQEVAGRIIPGHWEGDLIMGKELNSALGTLVERTTRAVILVPLTKKDAPSVRRAFARETKQLPTQMKLSLTYDRGKEMSEHELFTKSTKIMVYFAHPQSSWERGTNENTNGLIRQYFPKGTDFHTITKKQIKKVQDLLNGRPRKVLNFQTPYEVFYKLLH